MNGGKGVAVGVRRISVAVGVAEEVAVFDGKRVAEGIGVKDGRSKVRRGSVVLVPAIADSVEFPKGKV